MLKRIIPAFRASRTCVAKYACSGLSETVSCLPRQPQRPVSGCIAGAGVLAEVVVSKFAEHQPLYRFEDVSTRYGLYLPRSTLCELGPLCC